MRRPSAFLGILSLLASGVVHAATPVASSFPDTIGTPFEAAFTALRTRSIVKGYPDGKAYPYLTLNRVEALKIVLQSQSEIIPRVTWMRSHLPPLPLFSDTHQSEWYAPYVEVAYEQGIVTGYPDATFRPSRPLTVEEAIVLLLRAHHIKGKSDVALLSEHIENRQGTWFTAEVNAAIERNLVMKSAGLRLGAQITRGQFGDIVYRLLEITEKKATSYSGPEPLLVAREVQKSVPPANPPAQRRVTDHPYASEKHFAITMPSLGVTDLTITHPEDPFSKDGVLSVLKLGVGHLFSYPGGGGKIMVYGHSSAYPWDVSSYTKVFRRINELAIGDRVFVTYAGKLHIYEVTRKQSVPATETQDAFRDDGTGEELILYTCWPPDSISERYLVHALPVETVALE